MKSKTNIWTTMVLTLVACTLVGPTTARAFQPIVSSPVPSASVSSSALIADDFEAPTLHPRWFSIIHGQGSIVQEAGAAVLTSWAPIAPPEAPQAILGTAPAVSVDGSYRIEVQVRFDSSSTGTGAFYIFVGDQYALSRFDAGTLYSFQSNPVIGYPQVGLFSISDSASSGNYQQVITQSLLADLVLTFVLEFNAQTNMLGATLSGIPGIDPIVLETPSVGVIANPAVALQVDGLAPPNPQVVAPAYSEIVHVEDITTDLLQYMYSLTLLPFSHNGFNYDTMIDPNSGPQPGSGILWIPRGGLGMQAIPAGQIGNIPLRGDEPINVALVSAVVGELRATIYTPLSASELAALLPPGQMVIDYFHEAVLLPQGLGQDYIYTLTSVPPNSAPVAVAGPDQLLSTVDTITFDGSQSLDFDSLAGSNDDIVQFDWYLDLDGNGVIGAGDELLNDSPVVLSQSVRSEVLTLDAGAIPYGTYEVLLRVQDSQGLSSMDRLLVAVGPGPQVAWTLTAPAQSALGSAHFEFEALGANYFMCKLDGVTVSANCPSPIDLSYLADGVHQLELVAVDRLFRMTSINYSWSVDQSPPETLIVSGPAGTVGSTTSQWVFASSEGGSFECQLDAGLWNACASPYTSNVVVSGQHTLLVRAIDVLGNIDPTPATHTWTIDVVPPVITVISVVPAANATLATGIQFSLSEMATVTCKLDGGAAIACVSPLSLILTEGPHSLEILAVDRADNVAQPVTVSWMVGGTAPVLQARIESVSGRGLFAVGKIRIETNDAGSQLTCRRWVLFRMGPWLSCGTGLLAYYSVPLRNFPVDIRATDSMGFVSNVVRLTVPRPRDNTSPNTAIARGLNSQGQPISPFGPYTFTSTEAYSSFECRAVPTGTPYCAPSVLRPRPGCVFVPYASCEEVHYVTSVPGNRGYTLQARATDPWGNVDATPAQYTVDVGQNTPWVEAIGPSSVQDIQVEIHGKVIDGDGISQAYVRVREDYQSNVETYIPLNWVAGSTVGEYTATVPLIRRLGQDYPNVLIVEAIDAVGNVGQATLTVTTQKIASNGEIILRVPVSEPRLTLVDVQNSLASLIAGQYASVAATPSANVYLVSQVADMEGVLDQLRQSGQFITVTPNYTVSTNLMAHNILGSDPSVFQQWHLFGQDPAAIDAVGAWASTLGSRDVTVAILDTGFELNHADLAANFSASGGKDFVGDDNDPTAELCGAIGGDEAYCNHGTLVAGVIGAVGGNGVGIAGVSPTVNMLPIRMLPPSNQPLVLADILTAIDYAVQNDAKVIVAAWTAVPSGGITPVMRDEFVSEVRRIFAVNTNPAKINSVFVGAAGDEGLDLGTCEVNCESFPALLHGLSNVILVGGSGTNRSATPSSNYGRAVDITAPAELILSTGQDGSYKTADGTSMAAAEVAGVLALHMAKYPQNSRAPADLVARISRASSALLYPEGGKLLSASKMLDVQAFPQPSRMFIDRATSHFASDLNQTSAVSKMLRCDINGDSFDDLILVRRPILTPALRAQFAALVAAGQASQAIDLLRLPPRILIYDVDTLSFVDKTDVLLDPGVIEAFRFFGSGGDCRRVIGPTAADSSSRVVFVGTEVLPLDLVQNLQLTPSAQSGLLRSRIVAVEFTTSDVAQLLSGATVPKISTLVKPAECYTSPRSTNRYADFGDAIIRISDKRNFAIDNHWDVYATQPDSVMSGNQLGTGDVSALLGLYRDASGGCTSYMPWAISDGLSAQSPGGGFLYDNSGYQNSFWSGFPNSTKLVVTPGIAKRPIRGVEVLESLPGQQISRFDLDQGINSLSILDLNGDGLTDILAGAGGTWKSVGQIQQIETGPARMYLRTADGNNYQSAVNLDTAPQFANSVAVSQIGNGFAEMVYFANGVFDRLGSILQDRQYSKGGGALDLPMYDQLIVNSGTPESPQFAPDSAFAWGIDGRSNSDPVGNPSASVGATFMDVDQDGLNDLIVASRDQPIRIYIRVDGGDPGGGQEGTQLQRDAALCYASVVSPTTSKPFMVNVCE